MICITARAAVIAPCAPADSPANTCRAATAFCGRRRCLREQAVPVAYFADLKPNGSVFSYDNPYVEKGLNVYTVYDKHGSVTGLKTE